jgi:hypothetical protein
VSDWPTFPVAGRVLTTMRSADGGADTWMSLAATFVLCKPRESVTVSVAWYVPGLE